MGKSYQKRESKAVNAIKNAIPSSLKSDRLPISKGMFAELYENKEVFPKHYLATAIDGVGTKIIIAEAMQKYDTVGIDLVAMSANDLATLGPVSPFLFMDYLACESKIQEKLLTKDIIKGIVSGLKQCDASKILRNSIRMNFGKGETASVDELISSAKKGYGFDVAGCMIGFIEKGKIKNKVSSGDKIIALPSSGAHSNGYTVLRHHLLNGDFETRKEFKKSYKGKFSLHDKFDNSTVGDALLKETRIYTKLIAEVSKNHDIIGINNTGNGLKNFNRIEGFEFRINNPLKPQPIFELMKEESKFSDEEMYKTLNMGMGFFIICNKDDADKILQTANGGKIVGEVKKSNSTRTVLEKGNKNIVFEGY
ncbi:phosphoribosylformylglycinamidine cyclo-ligase [archaeon]|jgi:phosphoribosylformylglycinamidine cyclo-ligase|nr:phosphoribosylformylglycinamidine cyclo-ligase [archaeon]MDP6547435.1 AIR synthase-related protein [Candidatus Woesearchaeota archaeon]|tara:strand:- start:29195 stop:30292 length:1098 start_codon:yes stop_codon:yes gene_type:complete